MTFENGQKAESDVGTNIFVVVGGATSEMSSYHIIIFMDRSKHFDIPGVIFSIVGIYSCCRENDGIFTAWARRVRALRATPPNGCEAAVSSNSPQPSQPAEARRLAIGHCTGGILSPHSFPT